MARYIANVKSLKKKSKNCDGEINIYEYPNPIAEIKQKNRYITVRHLHEAQMIKKSMNEFIRSINGKHLKTKKSKE